MIKENTDSSQKPFRAFFGVELSTYAQGYITDIIENLQKKLPNKNIKWTIPEKLHTTVRFLGHITQEQSTELIQSVDKTLTEFEPFSVRFSSLSALPNLQTPKIIILEPNPISSLAALNIIIDRIAIGMGIPKDNKPFHPHLTLGKIHNKPFPNLKSITFPHIVLKVNTISLFRSDTLPEGAKYTVLATIPLLKKD